VHRDLKRPIRRNPADRNRWMRNERGQSLEAIHTNRNAGVGF